jgi:hypothetical protein
MADPIKVFQSLGAPLASQYTVFERDQVLTHTQLNEVATWLDQQDRLSRVSLVGIGIITGLHLSADGASVSVAPGIGITSDGDLIRLAEPLMLAGWRSYDATAPRYEPFYDATGATLLVSGELVADNDPLGTPLASLPGVLNNQAVALLMECIDSDPDLCTGADCDNLGRERQHRLRVLLLGRDAAARLAAGPLTLADQARALPEAIASRPQLGADLTRAENLFKHYQDANSRTVSSLVAAFTALGAGFAGRIGEVFASNPCANWCLELQRQLAESPAAAALGFFAYVKDLTATYNELRDVLLGDASLLAPSPNAFPKHLVAGTIGILWDTRTPFFPAPTDAHAREAAAAARFLIHRLDQQISCYIVPEDRSLRVTPSHGEERPLGERAIPWYYRADIHLAWNRRLSARQLGNHNLGYRATEYSGSARAIAPLAGAIAAHSFFRVEGHLGRSVNEVRSELKKLIADHNLPFEVHAVLAHSKKELIKIRPGIRYTDLHRVHYLLRQDVSLRLDESDSFSEKYVGSLRAAIASKDIPEQTDTGISVLGAATSARSAVGTLTARAKPALDQQTYSAYRATTSETRWNNGLCETLGSMGAARVNLGKLSRSDFVSPVDSLIQTTHPLWLDWLDELIKAKDDNANDKLLLSRFATDHPGLDHLGGAWRGGTFVLVYDDAQNVIADFTLAYPCAEADEPEPVEPPLLRPPLRRPPLEIDPIKVIRPVDLVVSTLVGTAVSSRFDTARIELAADLKAVQSDLRSRLETQSANIDGLVRGAFSTKEATGAVVLPGKTIATGDAVLDQLVKDVEYKRQKVQTLVELSSQGNLSEESRSQAQALLIKAQSELGDSVAETTEHVVTQKVDTSAGAAVGVASVLANSTVYITNSAAASSLGSKLETLKTGATSSSQTVLIGNLQNLNRLTR